VIAFGMTAVAFAQNARISGNVTDPHGAAVVGAEVQVISLSTGNKFVTKTGNDGSYNAPFLPAGHYQIIVSAKGFSQTSKGDLAISEGQVSLYDAKLTIVGTSEQVIVKGKIDSIPNANPEVAVGPFTNKAIQDLPYSITVVPSSLIDNLQAWQPEDLAKVIPQMTVMFPDQNSTGNPTFLIRGFTISEFTNGGGTTYDGLIGGAGGYFLTTLEDKERVEVLSGTDGFLYGLGSVGGNINYVLKRPTETPYFSVTAGDNAGANGYVHVDAGGPTGKNGIFGYRINAVEQNGPTSIKYQSIKRDLLDGAVDIHVRPNLLVQLNYAHDDYDISGLAPNFWLGYGPTVCPKAPDPRKVFTAPWLQFMIHTNTGGVKATWRLNKTFTFRTFYDYTDETRPQQFGLISVISDNAGDLWGFFSGSNQPQWNKTNALYSFLDADFRTFGIHHKLTVGFNGSYGYVDESSQSTSFANNSYTNNIYNMTPVAEPALSTSTVTAYATGTVMGNYLIGDDLSFGRYFHVLGGLNEVIYKSHTFQDNPKTIQHADDYDSSKLTPSIAFTYKPLTWLTAYASYQQSLLPGVVVPGPESGIVYTNANAVLPPYPGRQYEAGVKATLTPGVLVTAAIFHISEANIYTIGPNSSGEFTEFAGGSEIHKGLEFTATGKVRPDLTIFSGLTLLDPRIENNPSDPTQNGDKPQGVPTVLGKVYAEYDLPRTRGLAVLGGFYYTGSSYITLPNTLAKPAYTTEDSGVRYTVNISDKPLTFRFNINNVTNKAYWASYTGYVGAPRTFLATAQYRF
jgi:iron complex outermembrane receptor protein